MRRNRLLRGLGRGATARGIFLALASVGLAFAVPLLTGSAPRRTARYLYLLAGTPRGSLIAPPPLTLLTVSRGHRPRVLRTVCGGGMLDVRGDGEGTLYAICAGQTKIALIHETGPMKGDRVLSPMARVRGAMDSGELHFYYAGWGIVAGPGVPTSAVLPFLARGGVWQANRVYGSRGAEAPRLLSVADPAGLYRVFRYFGPGGGPYRPPAPQVNIQGDRLTMPATAPGTAPWTVQRIPVSLLPPGAGRFTTTVEGPSGRQDLVARFGVIVSDTPTEFAFAASTRGDTPTKIYVRVRSRSGWSVLGDAFTSFIPRTFGPWIAVIVQEPADGRESPGLENEKPIRYGQYGSLTLPIRGEYPTDVYMPGRVDLFNVENGREVRVDTGQQDSEVLDVSKSGQVLYRVNDEIFSAQIEGDKIGPSTLVVKGEDVPEVHWVFWSKAKPPSPPAKVPSGNPR